MKARTEGPGISRRTFYILLAVAVIVKLLLVSRLSIWASPYSVHDDQLMASNAYSILAGDWLGDYTQYTLIKGVTYPLLLAGIYCLGIPYLAAVVLLSAFACFGMTMALKKLIPNRLHQLIFFVLLFYSPIYASTNTLLRVYRDSVTAPFAMLCFAAVIGCFMHRGERQWIWWLLGAGIAVFLFMNLREDSIWILPFVVGALAVTALMVKGWRKKALLLIPLIVLFLGNQLICFANYSHYGVYGRTDLTSGSFAEMLKTIYSVRPEEDIPMVAVPKSTVDKLYDASPSFAELKDVLDYNYGAGWDGTDGEIDGQIKDGWFFWCLRDCMQGKGYFESAEKMQSYCERVTEELQAALDSGALEKRAEPVMPSALMSPWRNEYLGQLAPTFFLAYRSAVNFEDCRLAVQESIGDIEAVERIEALTGDTAIRAGGIYTVEGWLAMHSGNAPRGEFYYNGELVMPVVFQESEDVYRFLSETEGPKDSYRQCRFRASFSVPLAGEKIELYIYDGEELADIVEIAEDFKGQAKETYTLSIDSTAFSENSQALRARAGSATKALSWINSLYEKCAGPLNMLALVCYAGITAAGVVCLKKRKEEAEMLTACWLILTGMLASAAINLFGVSYTTISAFSAISGHYLASAYALLWTFTILAIYAAARFGWRGYLSKSEERNGGKNHGE